MEEELEHTFGILEIDVDFHFILQNIHQVKVQVPQTDILYYIHQYISYIQLYILYIHLTI